MRQLLLSILFTGCFLNGYSQDTIRQYIKNDFTMTVKDSAAMIREIITHKNYYAMTHFDMQGTELSYSEFKSLETLIPHGLAKHYYDPGAIYSTGTYYNGKLMGKWSYYDINGVIDTVTYQPLDYYKKTSEYSSDITKLKKPSAEIEQRVRRSIFCFLRNHFHLPARLKNLNQDITFTFKTIIDLDGKLKNIEILSTNNEDLQIEVYRVLSMYKCDFEIKKAFETTLFYKHTESYTTNNSFNACIDNMPQFPGGTDRLNHYLANSFKYPLEAKKLDLKGKVYVSFVVDKTGKITDIKIIKSLHFLLDNEAIRLVKSMPDWIPGTQDGKPVNIMHTLPISFE